MCGLTGFWDRSASTSGDELERLAVAMRETLVRRGPDDAGVWVDPAAGCTRLPPAIDRRSVADRPSANDFRGWPLRYRL